MKRVLGYVAIVVLAALASAQVFAQSIIRNMELNTAKSKYTAMQPQKK